MPMTSDHDAIMLGAAKMGLVHGYTYPINRAGEPSGSCTFASRYHRILDPVERQCTIAIASDALAVARRLRGFPALARARPHLSPQLRKCLELLVIGKTDNEIAELLNIRPQTARTYVKRTRARFNVMSRAQLGAEALRSGVFGFSDIPRPPRH